MILLFYSLSVVIVIVVGVVNVIVVVIVIVVLLFFFKQYFIHWSLTIRYWHFKTDTWQFLKPHMVNDHSFR